MYQFLKKILKVLVPKKLLINAEPRLRKIFSVFYKGNNVYCVVCEKNFSRFIKVNNDDLLCPACGSKRRDRFLYFFLKKENHLKGRMLDFSPARCLYRKFKTINSIDYFPTDFSGEFIAAYHFDINSIDQPDEYFDYIICFHVLEHVEDDKKAMAELFRVLKTSGRLFIQTPFKSGDIYEDAGFKSPAERLRYFGQEDHVRIYSIGGLKDRLTKTGFHAEVISNINPDFEKYGFDAGETLLQCRKS